MRATVRASAAMAFFALVAGASACAEKRPLPPPREPPARVLATTFDRVSVRANAYVELHAWLASAARSDAEVPPELAAAKKELARVMKEDLHDERIASAARTLSVCADDRCASRAVSALYGNTFEEALPLFIQRHWAERAGAAHAAIDATRAAFGVESEALMARLVEDLAITLPDAPVTIDVVSEAPPVGNEALLPILIGARGTCFIRQAREELKVQHARILDCVLTRALVALSSQSRLYAALARELKEERLERAWTLVVVHAVAVTLTGWEPRHQSPMRRSANAEPRAREPLAWLHQNWSARANRSESVEAFAARFSAEIR